MDHFELWYGSNQIENKPRLSLLVGCCRLHSGMPEFAQIWGPILIDGFGGS